ncbi:23S rRNA methyltransferase [Actinoplanes sp. Pm04-4]|uniref:23S rRNA methyltransferase n=1 Tax=Paractinoplanes pyxinae TaxID=2997416 RepID=A0ABT4BEJ1_9ACTN|nr:methyltransferase domain-containing protein [Actinoplanes pyxinae]MCY1144948.1 23S rRNA methyltransferase [Actinoplanes pyxinae]
MIDGALPYLRCPVCRQPLERTGRTLRCPARHSFDMAKQGYADLTAGRMPHVGDTAEMVADRDAFLSAGHYDFIADALAPRSGFVVDAGTGTGYYLARALSDDAVGLGLDVSKPALRRAARAHPRVGAVLTDLWRPLPIADGVADVILNVFAPRNGPEFHRILRPDGLLLVVTPQPDHLRELIATHRMIHVDPDKAARVQDALGDHFVPDETISLSRELKLTATETRTLIGMTPSAHHTADVQAAPSTVTASVLVTTYRRISD